MKRRASLITRAIALISPRLALRRARDDVALASFYESAETTRLRRTKPSKASARVQIERDGTKMRASARAQEANFDIAAGVLDVLVNNVIGRGIWPEAQVKKKDGTPADDFNRQLMKAHRDWARTPEVTHEFDFATAQRLAARSFFRDGEMFTQHVTGTGALIDHGTRVPYSIELLEADYCPFEVQDFAPASGDARVVNGVALNVWGRPRAYFLHKSHPGDPSGPTDLKRVPADRIVHIKFMRRLHQVRGVSALHAVLNRFDDIKDIDESERVAARVAAAMAAFIKKGDPQSYGTGGAQGSKEPRMMDMQPGMIFDDLLPGESIEPIRSDRPNNSLIPFRDSQLRSAAAGVGAGFSSISRNYDGTYSAQRQELVEGRTGYEVIGDYFARRWCDPVWGEFVFAAIAAGIVKLTADLDLDTLYDASHTLPAIPWIDPMKEAEANAVLEDRGYKSRLEIIRERGRNPSEVNEEFVRDRNERDHLDLDFGTRSAPQPAPAPPDDPDAGARTRTRPRRNAA